MKQLCVDRDFAPLAAEAHWLKGTGGTVGYPALTQPAADLESAAKRQSAEDAQTCLDRVIAVRDRIAVHAA